MCIWALQMLIKGKSRKANQNFDNRIKDKEKHQHLLNILENPMLKSVQRVS